MKKTLQDQYLLIKEGKGHKGVFLADAKRDFPHIVPNAATFEEAAASLKTKNIISENVIGLSAVAGYEPRKKESYETAFEAFLAEAKKKENEDEKVKAEEKKVSKPVEKDLEKNFDYSDDKNPDNLIFDQIMMGYYAEMKDPKNADKTMQQLKDIVLKNLAKDPIHYTKDGQFGVKDLGYVTEHPGLGTPKEPKGKYASSGYGNLSEAKELNVGDKVKYKGITVTVEKKDEVGNLILKSESGKTIRANKSQFKEYGSLEEEKLRKAIREMIDAELGEATQMTTIIRPKTSDKERQERDTPSAPSSTKIPSLLVKKLERRGLTIEDGVIKMPKLLQVQIEQKKIDFIKDLSLNKGLQYSQFKALADTSNYTSAGGNMLKFKKAKPNEDGSITIYPSDIKEDTSEYLRESVEKDLAAINKEAEHEVLQSKLDKIDVLIDKRKSQLGKLDEDEDMKALTDKKKVKELQKDIKKLEQAKAKVEKIIGKTKTKKKEVIDETDAPDNLVSNIPPGYIRDAEERLRDGESIDSIIGNYPNLSFEDKNNLRSFLTWQQDSDIGQAEELEEGFLGNIFSKKDEELESMMQEADELAAETGKPHYVMAGSYGRYVTDNPSGKSGEQIYSTEEFE